MSNQWEGWKPGKQSRLILNRAMEHIRSVDYKVSARWVFYRLYQEGLYELKGDYNNKFIPLSSKARKSEFEEWRPWTLADDTRELIYTSWGECPETYDIDDKLKEIKSKVSVYIGEFYNQDYYVAIAYEARAMTAQFQHYTNRIDLIPFGGEPSIPFRYRSAQMIMEAWEKYQKPCVLLYFGDCDDKGIEIYQDACSDIVLWGKSDTEVIRCGLTEEQAIKYGVPESIKGEGYQWEALTDEAATEIITSNVNKYYDTEKALEAREQEKELTDKIRERIT